MIPEVISFFRNSVPECLLVVHPDIQHLGKFEGMILADYPVTCLQIGKELSAVLLTTPPSQRSRAARQWLEIALREKAPGPVLCMDIDLLFQPSFDLDPLLLFRQISRFTRLLVLWPGAYGEGVLAYAVPEHRHYRVWRQPHVAIIGVPNALS